MNQSSAAGIVGWSTFSIGQSNQVQFNNGTGATLNRVTGNVPSSIDGRLSATGSVYLINPAGVAVGPTGIVRTDGSFVASTLDVRDGEFIARGPLTFGGNSQASVVNLGKIGSSNGDVILIARTVQNDGTISAKSGTAALASGSEVVLTDGALGNGKVLVRMPTDGQARNSGRIRAAEVELRANGGNVLALAGNTRSVIKATGIANKGGRIFLTATGGSVVTTQRIVAQRIARAQGKSPQRPTQLVQSHRAPRTTAGGDITVQGDSVSIGGPIDARGTVGSGGRIVVTGNEVTLTSGAVLDASGTSGGIVLVGGDRWGGADPAARFLTKVIPNAQTTTVQAEAVIRADGHAGDGGKVVVWSDARTDFAGLISARGGGRTGAGGFAEVSGHLLLNFAGTVDLSANSGKTGTLLLDPYSVTLANSANSNMPAITGGTFTPNGNSSVLNVASLQTALLTSNVVVTTGAAGSPGAQAGDITVADVVTWSSANSLTLSAYRNVMVNANLSNSGGAAVVLRADNSGTGVGTVSFASGKTVSTSGAVSVFYNPSANPAGSAVNGTSYANPTENYSGNVAGGGSLKAYMLVNTVQDLQNINNRLNGLFALGRDIDASATATWNSGAGFIPIGNSNAGPVGSFAGTFDGQNQVITGLTINRSTTNSVGLFGTTGGTAIVRNIGLTGGSFAGNNNTGSLVGFNQGMVSDAYATASVTGGSSSQAVGGLLGYNQNAVSNSYATGTVIGRYAVGGLIGLNYFVSGTVTNSYATGAVMAYAGADSVGGLVGRNHLGTISNSYATGTVSGVNGANSVGGLLGDNDNGIVSGSYATGAVTSTGLYTGGLVGFSHSDTDTFAVTHFYANVTDSYATGAVSGSLATGGLIGVNSFSFVSKSYATGAVSGTTTWVGGLIGFNNQGTIQGIVDQTYATGAVTGAGSLGGLIGNNEGPISAPPVVTRSYFDTNTTGMCSSCWVGEGTPSAGISPLGGSNPNPRQPASYAGWSFASDWFMIPGETRPFARGEYSTTISNAHQLQLIGMNATTLGASYKLGRSFSVTAELAAVGGKYPGMWTSSGFYPVGDNSSGTSATRFSGTLDGLGRTISGLAINRPTTDRVGLFGQTETSAVIRNLGLTGGSVVGRHYSGQLVGVSTGTITQAYATGTVTALSAQYVGGLVGYQDGGTISQSYTTGAVSGGDYVGGMVGRNTNGTITKSYATGAVNGSGALIGGLIGENYGYYGGSLTQSYATGPVTAASTSSSVGGLVGQNYVSYVADSYATGTVTGGNLNVGGLIGYHLGYGADLTQSYATGSVTSASGSQYVGGLVGSNHTLLVNSEITKSFATGPVSGSSYVGGLVGYNQAPSMVANSYARGAVTGVNHVGGLIGANDGTVTNTYATGLINNGVASANVGGLIGSNTGTVISSYWDMQTSGQSGSSGGVGLTTAVMQNSVPALFQATYVNWDFLTIWSPPSAGYYPELYALSHVLTVSPNNVTQTYGVANPTFSASYYGLAAHGDTSSIVANLTLATTAPSSSTGHYNAGSWSIYSSTTPTATSQDGTAYRVVVAPGTLLVNPLGLSATVTANSKVYDRNTTASLASSSLATVIVGDNVSLNIGGVSFADKNAGLNKQVIPSGLTLSGADAPNYGVTSVVATGTITQAPLTASVTANGKIYDRTTSATLNTSSLATIIAGDTVSLNVGSLTFADKNAGNNKQVTASGLTLSGADGGNYALTSPTTTTTAMISQAPLTASVTANGKVYDGTANATLNTSSLATVIAGDTVSLNVGSLGFANKNAGTGKTVTASGLTLSGADAANYTLTSLTAATTADITKAPVLAVIVVNNKTYDGTTAATVANAFILGGVVSGDSASLQAGSVAFNDKNAGNNKLVTASGFALSGPDAGNYSLTASPSQPNITAALLTYNAQAASRTYGAANPVFTGTVTGFVNGETQATATTGTLTFASPATATSNVGNYAINGSGLTANSGNYVILPSPASATALSVTPAPLFYVAGQVTRNYGAANPALTGTVTGFVNGETLATATTPASSLGFNSAVMVTNNVGKYEILGAGLTAKFGNYAFFQAPGNATALTIDPASLTYVALAASRTYGSPFIGSAGIVTGFVNGETQASATSGIINFTNPSTASSNVGSYPVTGSGLTAKFGNYVFGQAAGNATAHTVTPATLTYFVPVISRPYGDSNPTFVGVVTGFVLGQTQATATTGTLSFNAVATATSNVGTYAITGSGLTANSGNYSFVQGPVNATALTITPRPVTVTVVAKSKIYGDPDPALTFTHTNLGAGAPLAGSLTRSPGQNVGSYPIFAVAPLLIDPNYQFSFVPANLTINPATLTYAGNPVTQTYGTAIPALTGTVTGLVNGETLATATTGTATFATAATATSNVGSYPIIGFGLTAKFGNYVFAPPVNIPMLTITPATLTYVANPSTRTYGSINPAGTFTGTVTGFVNGDTLTSATNAVSAPIFISLTTPTSNVGSYEIRGIALTANNNNYVFAQAPGNATALTITPATLTYSALPISRTYGSPVFPSGGLITGFVNGENNLTVTTGSANFTNPTTVSSNVGTYAVTGSGLTANFGNYVFAQAPGNATAMTITPAPLTYFVPTLVRQYGDPNPLLFGFLSGFVNGETQATATTGTLSFSTAATATSNVGTYAITASGLTARFGNYSFSGAGTLIIAPRPVTLTTTAKGKTYGDADPALTFTTSSLGAGAVPAGSLLRAAGENVGQYQIFAAPQLLGNPNYQFSQITGNLTINPAPLRVTANDKTRQFGQPNPALTVSYSGFKFGDGPGVVSGVTVSTPAVASSPVDKYPIIPIKGSAANYVFNYVNGALIVTPALPPHIVVMAPPDPFAPGGPLHESTGLGVLDNTGFPDLGNQFGPWIKFVAP